MKMTMKMIVVMIERKEIMKKAEKKEMKMLMITKKVMIAIKMNKMIIADTSWIYGCTDGK